MPTDVKAYSLEASAVRPPNFIIGGSSASGTSFLSAVLQQHPQVYLPAKMRPEPHFFYKSWEFSRGWSYYLERWFNNVPQKCIAVGERSSSYLYGGRETADKMFQCVPEVKLVFILRNPIERTWANYRYTVLEGLEEFSFTEALERESDRVKSSTGLWGEIQPFDYTGRGFYGQQVAEFLEVFDRNQIHLMKSENLSLSTDVCIARLGLFMGLSLEGWSYHRPPEFTSLNVIDAQKQVQLRAELGERFDLVVEAVRLGQQLDSLGESPQEQRLINQLQSNLKSSKVSMPDSVRKYLRRLFSEDIQLLTKFVDFDVSDWQ